MFDGAPLPEAFALIRKGHDLGRKIAGWKHSESCSRESDRLIELYEPTPAIMARGDPLSGPRGLVRFARSATHDAGRFVATAKLFEWCLRAHPDWSNFPEDPPLYLAAAIAANATTNPPNARETLDDAAKAYWRIRALEWLSECLKRDVNAASLARDPDSRASLLRTWEFAKMDGWLIAVRDPGALAKLPDAEAQACRMFWQRVDAALADARFPLEPLAK
jgi:hypothetical protein